MKSVLPCILLSSLFLISISGSAQPAQQTTAEQVRSRASSGDDGGDPDIPSFMKGKIDKQEYVRLRSAHIGRLRGLPYPSGDNPRIRALRQMDRQVKLVSARQSQSPSTWVPLGPEPIPNGQTEGVEVSVSGRVTAIAIHPTNPETVYVGTAQGGVYRSFNGGLSWTAIFDNALSLAIGALAIDPLDNTTLFVGTGEGNLSLDCFFGVGLYIVRNAETAPTLSGPHNLDGGSNNVLAYRSINRILINPGDDNIVFVATTSGVGGSSGDVYPNRPPRGLYRTTNVMSISPTFTRLDMGAGSNTIITDAVLEPGDPNTLVAAIYGQSAFGSIGGIYRATNALASTPTFTQTLSITDGQNVKLTINKVGSVVTVYAATAESNGSLRKSTDGGQTWSAALSAANGFCYPQCWYDIAVAVDPTNADRVYVSGAWAGYGGGSSEFKMSLDGGSNFTDSYTRLHADVHALGIAESPHNNIIYEGNDGGIFRSTDYGNGWSSANTAGFNATQFEGIAVHPTDPHFTIGGTQDNGTPFLKPDQTWFQADWGDGGFSAIDQNATNTSAVTMYHTYYNSSGSIIGYARTMATSCAYKGGWEFRGIYSGSVDPYVYCDGTSDRFNGITLADNVLFYAPLTLGPGNPNTVYFGTDRLYRSADRGDNASVVSQAPLSSGMEVSAIGISPQNDNVRIVGLVNGQVFATTTGSSTLTDVTGALPAQFVARAIIDPSNANVAYVTLSGFGTPLSPVQHVWKTTSLLSGSWTSVSSGLPDVPVNAFVIDPLHPASLYCGTDIGVYHSTDAGASWTPFGSGLPRVAVFDMAIVPSSHVLRIATHGRGMWEITTSSCPTIAIAPPGLPGGTTGSTYDHTVTATGGTTPYTFSITSGVLPDGLTLSSAGQLSGTLTPAGHFSFALTATDGSGCTGDRSYNIDITSPTITVGVSLDRYWNLVSLPVTPSNNSVDSLFPSATSPAFAYSGAYVASPTMNTGTGYWLRFGSTQTDSIIGAPDSAMNISVVSGWNLVGSIFKPVAVSSITSTPPGIRTSRFFGYRSNYVATDTIRPGGGYWVKVSQDGVLTLSSSSNIPAASRISIVATDEFPPASPTGADIGHRTSNVPKEFVLEQNYPNPFNPNTVIHYQLPVQSQVTLKIFNLLGQEVKTLVDEIHDAGYESAQFDAGALASGMYFYQLEATSVSDPSKTFTQVKKLVLMK